MIGVHEREQIANSLSRATVAKCRDPPGGAQEGRARRERYLRRVLLRTILDDDDLHQVGRVHVSSDAGEAASQTTRVVAHRNDER